MSEFNAGGKNDPYNFNGTYNKNGGLKGVTPPQYSYSGNMQQHQAPTAPYSPAGYGGHGGGGGHPGPPGGHMSTGQSHLHHSSSRTAAIEDDEDEYDRGHWGSKAEFILSCVGFSVGIGNVWRFPYLAFQNGGAAFLIPYFILLILVGKPMYYMETAMGQFSRTSPLQLWECAPIAKGVGYGMLVLCLIVAIYYNVIMSYAIIYMGASIRGIWEPTLPWASCGGEDNWWGATENCIVVHEVLNNSSDSAAPTAIGGGGLDQDGSFNISLPRCYPNENITVNCTTKESSTLQFWEIYVLNLTKPRLGEPGDLGGFDYKIPLALFFSWTVVFLCLMKGVKSSGKVVYFTATFPYFILIALLVNGVLLDGAVEGLKFLFIPDWNKMADFTVWRKAAEQMFFSLGISWGGLVMFGSYNKFHNKINIDAGVVSSLDFLTSIIASVVIFSVLGHQAKELGVDIKDVAEGGQGLAFVAYPAALSQLPVSWLWSILFFAMLFFLGLDSEFALLETALTALYDGFPKLRNHKVKITFVACVCCFCLGLPCASYSGQYVLDLMDTYGAGFAVTFVGIWELVSLMWIYGVKNVCKDIKLMLGSEPGWFWKITWAGISPIFLTIIFVASVATWKEPKYNGKVTYPDWAHYVGWGLVGISAVQIPLWAIIQTFYYLVKGRVGQVVKPTRKWGPGDPQVRRAILDEQSGISRNGRHTYDNHAMGYDGYNNGHM